MPQPAGEIPYNLPPPETIPNTRPGDLMHRAAVLVSLLLAPVPFGTAQEVDLDVVHRIKHEAFEGSKVMDHLFYLTDVNGPRLTNSPGYRKAADWALATLRGWGLQNAVLEPWGEFGRGWSLEHFEAHLLEPSYAPLDGIPLAWSGSTDGPVSAPLVRAPLFERWEAGKAWDLDELNAAIDAYIEAHRGKLGGRIVLLSAEPELTPPTEPDSTRLDAQKLAELAEAPTPSPEPAWDWPNLEIPRDPEKRKEWFAHAPVEVQEAVWSRRGEAYSRLIRFLKEEGVVAALTADRRGSGALLFAEEVGPFWEKDTPIPPSVVVLAPEPYARIVRLVTHEIPVKVELDVRVAFQDDDLSGYNVVAEIPGGAKRDEVVLVGGHLDSWHAGTGATDDAAGCAVALEAVRILKTLGLKLDRTVRVALWGGEEEGIFGSLGYVRRHYGEPVTMKLLPEHETFSGYFNIDNGSGKIRGVYLQGNDMMRPVFSAWFAPFADLGVGTISIRNTSGTDHLSFDAVGLPGFQFIQDPLDYGSRTHHSDIDVYDHVVPADLMQASAVVASVLYDAANREEKLPRKPLPRPLAER
jgi:carboxypeptidase Q